MSDVKRWLKKKAVSPEIARVEAGERAEGVERALKSGAGDVVAGAKRLKMPETRPKMKPALATARCPAGVKPRRK